MSARAKLQPTGRQKAVISPSAGFDSGTGRVRNTCEKASKPLGSSEWAMTGRVSRSALTTRRAPRRGMSSGAERDWNLPECRPLFQCVLSQVKWDKRGSWRVSLCQDICRPTASVEDPAVELKGLASWHLGRLTFRPSNLQYVCLHPVTH